MYFSVFHMPKSDTISNFNWILIMSSDIDECDEGSSGCEQNCQNSDGNFTCSCFDDYTLKDDVCTRDEGKLLN